MSQRPAPPPPETLPEQESLYRNSRYSRRRSPIALWALLIGLLIGLGGGLYYAYMIEPVVETATRPEQLSDESKAHYVVAIMLAFSYDSDLLSAADRLNQLDLGPDPIGAVADIACDLARTGYVDSTSGLRAVRAMRTFYQLQGRTGCADTIIPGVREVPLEVTLEVPTLTPTLPPPPTKTPSISEPTATPNRSLVTPTAIIQRTYNGLLVDQFCSAETSGVIEVRVRDRSNQEVPGEPVRVQWDGGSSDFVTGLKPERGAGYADFEMSEGIAYVVSLPGLSDPLGQPLPATPCVSETGEDALWSYQVVFVRTGG